MHVTFPLENTVNEQLQVHLVLAPSEHTVLKLWQHWTVPTSCQQARPPAHVGHINHLQPLLVVAPTTIISLALGAALLDYCGSSSGSGT